MKLRLGISEAITHWAKYNPEKICVTNENFALSFKELNSIVNYFSEKELFVKISNNCVPLMIENKLLLLIGIIAAIRCKKFPAILNPNLKIDEIEYALRDLNTKILITESKFSNQISTDIIFYDINNSLIANNKNFYSDKIWDTPSLEDTWGILYSSGTTGKPKGINRSNFSILSELLGWCFELETRNDSNYYIARPVYYTGGLVLSMTVLLVGGKVSLYDIFSPEIYFDHIKKEKTELSFLVPSQIRILIDYLKQNNISKPQFSKKILSMGAPFSEQLKIEAKQFLKSDIIESWGNTEGLGTITNSSDLDLRPTSIGKPFLTDDLFIVDENFKRIKINTIGRLAGRVDSKFTEYNNRKELNDELIRDELIISEDLGMEDEYGYFYLYGRVSDVIYTLSGNVYPIVIEKMISSFDEVDEVAVIGVKNGEKQNTIGIIKPKHNIVDLNSLLQKINSKLTESQKLIELKVISEFPKTASGKIKKNDLEQLFKKT